MKIFTFRRIAQILFFLLLMYGGYVGLRFKNFLPVWSCPNSEKSTQGCYLLPLQRSQYGIETNVKNSKGMVLSGYFILMKWKGYLFLFLGFVLVALILNRTWCGWVCPFGTFQDGATFVRKKLKIKDLDFSEKIRNNLKLFGYLSVFAFLIIPLLVPFGFDSAPEPFFCQFCPVKAIMPIFGLNFLNLAVHSTNELKILENLSFFVFPAILTIIFTAVTLVAVFFKSRTFCFFCPIGTMIGFFHKFSLLKIKKNIQNCVYCGKCWKACPMGIKSVYLENKQENISKEECILCLKCLESCSQARSISLKIF